jgi:hypothetical protein
VWPFNATNFRMNQDLEVYSCFERLLDIAENCHQKGDNDAAIGVIQVAVRYIFPGKGLFASPRMERLLLSIGRQMESCPIAKKGRENGKRHVLHIMTHARPIGGDCRFAWRWMLQDPDSEHSLAITTQDAVSHLYEIPSEFVRGVENSGGVVHVLKPGTNALQRACELRVLCQETDVVVLHLFPYDIVPVLALAENSERVKTIFVNHADHTFWIGGSVAHLIVHLRSQPTGFIQNRRGLAPKESGFLPIPLFDSHPVVDQDNAKRRLGITPNTVVLLSIASPFKFSSPGYLGLLDLVQPTLLKCFNVVFIVIGPSNEGIWRNASKVTGGRVRPMGKRWDTDLFYAAADIYLDSVPFSSITSLLEAGSRGVPLLSLRPSPELELLGPGAPGLEGRILLAHDRFSYQVLLERLIKDPTWRQEIGTKTQGQIRLFHQENWQKSVQEVYKNIDAVTERKCMTSKADSFESDALNLALRQLYSNVPFSIRSLIREYLCILPFPSRFFITLRLYRAGLSLCFLNLLPSPADQICYSFGRWGKYMLAFCSQAFRGVFKPRTILPSKQA